MLKFNTLADCRPFARLWPTRLPQQEKCVFHAKGALFRDGKRRTIYPTECPCEHLPRAFGIGVKRFGMGIKKDHCFRPMRSGRK